MPGETICTSVQEGYARWAPTYDRDPNPLLALEERQLKLMLPRLEGKRVLDLACGTGRWLAWLMAAGAGSGVGVDFSPAMLAVAKAKFAGNSRLVRANCGAIPFARAAFDLVVCSFAVGHISDLQPVAREVGRVAAAGADVFVSDVHPWAHGQGWRTGFRDRRGAAQIATWPRPTHEFLAPGFPPDLIAPSGSSADSVNRSGKCSCAQAKGREFDGLCRVPAVLMCHFERSARR